MSVQNWQFPTILLTWPKLSAQAFRAYCVILVDCRENGRELPCRVALSLTEFGRRLGSSHASAGRWMANLVDVGLAEKTGTSSRGVVYRILDADQVAATIGFRVVKGDPQGLLFELDPLNENVQQPEPLNGSVQPRTETFSSLNGSVQLLEAAIGSDKFILWLSKGEPKLLEPGLLEFVLPSVFHCERAAEAIRGTDIGELRVMLVDHSRETKIEVESGERSAVCENSVLSIPRNTNTRIQAEPAIVSAQPAGNDISARFVSRMSSIVSSLPNCRGIYQWVIAAAALLIETGLEYDGQRVQFSENDLESIIERTNQGRKGGAYFVGALRGRISDILGRPAELPQMRELADVCRGFGYQFDFQWMQCPAERRPLERRKAT